MFDIAHAKWTCFIVFYGSRQEAPSIEIIELEDGEQPFVKVIIVVGKSNWLFAEYMFHPVAIVSLGIGEGIRRWCKDQKLRTGKGRNSRTRGGVRLTKGGKVGAGSNLMELGG